MQSGVSWESKIVIGEYKGEVSRPPPQDHREGKVVILGGWVSVEANVHGAEAGGIGAWTPLRSFGTQEPGQKGCVRV